MRASNESRPCLLPPIPFLNSPREKNQHGNGAAGAEGGNARYSARGAGSEHWHAIGAYERVASHHALGACESVGVGAKIGSSRFVDTHQTRDKVGFGMAFGRGGDRTPRVFGRAARFARVESEVRKIQKPKIFGEGFFWRGTQIQMQNTNAEIYKYIAECLPQTHPCAHK